MHKIFDPDNKFNVFMSRVGDLLLLNILFILTSLPIITMGAAWTALYTVCFRFNTEREEGTVHSYLKAFKENFRQSTAAWLVLLVVLGLSLYSLLFFLHITGPMHFFWFISGIGLSLAVLVFCSIFPLMSQFDNTLGQTFKNALILGVAYLPRFLLLALIFIFPFALFLLDLYIFMRVGFIFLLLHFAFTAYVGSRILRKPFQVLADNAAEENGN